MPGKPMSRVGFCLVSVAQSRKSAPRLFWGWRNAMSYIDKAMLADGQLLPHPGPIGDPERTEDCFRELEQDLVSEYVTASLFDMGEVAMTSGVSHLVVHHGLNLIDFLSRHEVGDWGDLCDEDKASNQSALTKGGRLFSSYDVEGIPTVAKVYIITESDRTVTTVLLPSEY